MSSSTTRLGIQYPSLSDSAQITTDMGNIATRVDTVVTGFVQQSTQPSTVAGYLWWCTNSASTSYGLNYCDGTNWHRLTTDVVFNASSPSAAGNKNQIWFNTTTDQIYYYDGTVWSPLSIDGGNITGTIAASLVSGALVSATIAGSAVTGTLAGSKVSGALTSATIAGSAVTGSIAASQVSGSLTSATIAGSAVTGNVAASQVNGALINATIPGSGVTSSIAAAQVSGVLTSATIDGGSVTGNIQATQVSGSLSSATISGGAVTGTLAASQVNGALTSATIAGGSVTGTNVLALAALAAGNLPTGAVAGQGNVKASKVWADTGSGATPPSITGITGYNTYIFLAVTLITFGSTGGTPSMSITANGVSGINGVSVTSGANGTKDSLTTFASHTQFGTIVPTTTFNATLGLSYPTGTTHAATLIVIGLN